MTDRAPSDNHQPARSQSSGSRAAVLLALVVLGFLPIGLTADEVRIQNGDHYAGQVLTLNTNSLVLQSTALGKVTLPRRHLASIMLAPGIANAPASSGARSEDEVWMRNGDRFAGRVLSLNTNTLILQSPVLGKISLSRCEVSSITLTPMGTNQAALAFSSTNPGTEAASPTYPVGDLGGLSLNNSQVQDIKSQLLNDAGPEANQQFNDLVAGLLSGKLGVSDIRAQAQSVAAQARALKRDLGNDPAAESMDSYLEILDKFLQETAPAGTKTAPPAKSK